MNYGAIKPVTIENGPGIRVSLFVSGCRRQCNGCHNPESWNFNYGEDFTDDTLAHLLELLAPSYVTGLSILGGEPFEPENVKAVTTIVHAVRSHFGDDKDIWIYSGYEFWEISHYESLLECCDYLVDGAFDADLKDLDIQFRGSSNQHIIDLKKTFAYGTTVIRKDERNELEGRCRHNER